MLLGQIAQKARDLTNTDTTSYQDAKLLVDINIWLEKTVTMILDSADDVDFDDARYQTAGSGYPRKSTPLALQRDYTIPVSEKVLKIKRVDISYDGVTAYRATPMDSGEWQGGIAYHASSGLDTALDSNFVKTNPRYDVAYNSVFIYPMPVQADVDAGGFVVIEWERQPILFTTSDYTSVLTDSTVTPGFDDPFHPILAYGPAMEYAAAKNQPQLAVIQGQLQDYENRLRAHYGRKDWDRQLAMAPDFTNSFS